jgi:GNAT superfamily N-acetyltransferase
MAMQIRPAMIEDAQTIAKIVIEGDDTFATFAPPDWERPSFESELAKARGLFDSSDRWVRVAEVDGEIVGYAAFIAAALTRMPVADPGLAHLGRLFVRRAHWGRGVATRLHYEAIAAASAEGFSAMRLFTPSLHARARRFYEREGWRAVGEMPESPLGLALIEYRLDLSGRRR